jgi:hypothetical protein
MVLTSIAHAGLENLSQGPYFRWNVELTSAEIEEAESYIHAVISDEGPFDGVMGFSQGSSLLASILLKHEIEHPKEAPPFRFAILFSCFLVISSDPTFAQKYYEIGEKEHIETVLAGLQVGDSPRDIDGTIGNDVKEEQKGKKEVKAPTHKVELISRSKRAALVGEIVDAVASSARTSARFHSEVSHVPTDTNGGLESFPRVYHPAIMSERIQIPTVHIVGRNDPFLKQTVIAKKLWEKKRMRYVEHSGGHDTPRTEFDVRAAVAGARWAIQQSEIFQSRWYSH